jgi:hypothetical protein
VNNVAKIAAAGSRAERCVFAATTSGSLARDDITTVFGKTVV